MDKCGMVMIDCPYCTDRLKEKKLLGAGCHDEIGCEKCLESGYIMRGKSLAKEKPRGKE